MDIFCAVFQIQLTPQQLQVIQMQLQGKHNNNPIIIQTSAAQPVQTQTLTQGDQQFTTSQVTALNTALQYNCKINCIRFNQTIGFPRK